MQYPRLLCIGWAGLAAACGPSKEDIVAEIGEYRITAPAIRAFVEQLPPGQYLDVSDQSAKRQYLQTLVDRQLLLMEARARGLDTTSLVLQALAATPDSLPREYILLEALKHSAAAPDVSPSEEVISKIIELPNTPLQTKKYLLIASIS